MSWKIEVRPKSETLLRLTLFLNFFFILVKKDILLLILIKNRDQK